MQSGWLIGARPGQVTRHSAARSSEVGIQGEDVLVLAGAAQRVDALHDARPLVLAHPPLEEVGLAPAQGKKEKREVQAGEPGSGRMRARLGR